MKTDSKPKQTSVKVWHADRMHTMRQPDCTQERTWRQTAAGNPCCPPKLPHLPGRRLHRSLPRPSARTSPLPHRPTCTAPPRGLTPPGAGLRFQGATSFSSSTASCRRSSASRPRCAASAAASRTHLSMVARMMGDLGGWGGEVGRFGGGVFGGWVGEGPDCK